MSVNIYVAAIEDSGDALGADVINELRRLSPDILIEGVGGKKMRTAGVKSEIDVSDLSVLGFFEGLRAYKRVKERVEVIAKDIERADPDAVVLIDSWGFMWRLAKRLKKANSRARMIKLLGPQVWATRPGRAKVLSRWCDHLLCIHAFEQPFYVPYGLPTTVIGNPALGRLEQGDAARFRQRHAISNDAVLIGLLPGSRKSELARVAPTLASAAEYLCKNDPHRHVIALVAPSVAHEVAVISNTWKFPNTLIVDERESADAMAAMSVSLACSGTVTTELAAQGSALIVGYKLGWITWVLARLFLWRARFITLLNMAAGREVAPEFVQTTLTTENLVKAAERLLSNPAALCEQREAQDEALRKMQVDTELPAARIAAGSILDQIKTTRER